MGLIKKAIFLVIAGFIGKFIFQNVILLGFFSHIYHHQPGPCRIVPGIEYGSEDAQATSDGLLFVTSGMTHHTDPDNPHFKNYVGEIFLVDTKAKDTQAVALPIQGGLNRETFSPHGLSLWKDKQSGKQYLYVVNHRPERDYVEKFIYDGKEKVLKHQASFTSDEFGLINDLVVIGHDLFYYTNWHYFRSRLGHQLELYLGLKLGGVGYYDGKKFSMVVTGLMQPNGINISPDEKYLYVATVDKQIVVYLRGVHGSLSFHHRIPVNTIPDNIDVDQKNGDLFIGCHPIPYKVIPYLDNPRASNPPSQVIRLKMADGGATDIEEIYAEDEHMVFGSSVAVYVSGRLYIGTVFHKMAECDVKYMS